MRCGVVREWVGFQDRGISREDERERDLCQFEGLTEPFIKRR
jgi:hypothetical protein